MPAHEGLVLILGYLYPVCYKNRHYWALFSVSPEKIKNKIKHALYYILETGFSKSYITMTGHK
jgi:hypothetical protein